MDIINLIHVRLRESRLPPREYSVSVVSQARLNGTANQHSADVKYASC